LDQALNPPGRAFTDMTVNGEATLLRSHYKLSWKDFGIERLQRSL
jgi:hypothetical protein